MQKFKLAGLVILISAFAACKQAPQGDKAVTKEAQEVVQNSAAKEVNVNTAESRFEWVGTKVTQMHSGTVDIKSGKLQVEGNSLKGGSFIMDMPTLVATNLDAKTNEALTKHLKGEDFFNVEKFPEAKFEITDVNPFSGAIVEENTELTKDINEYRVTDPNATISGNLTIKDVTKNISFPAKVEINNGKVNAMAKFMLDRKLWGITYKGMPDDLIKDDLWFGISIVASY